MRFSDLATYYRMPGPNGGSGKHRIALVVQHKSAWHETKGSVWSKGTKQLGDYIFAKVGETNYAERTIVYGAIANGLYVKFLK